MTLERNDDHHKAELGDRIIAGVIGGFCGFLFGGLLGYLAQRFLGSSFALPWIIGAGFALYGFLAPLRSTQLWSSFWESILSLFGRTTPRL